jgi:hypothetical protein
VADGNYMPHIVGGLATVVPIGIAMWVTMRGNSKREGEVGQKLEHLKEGLKEVKKVQADTTQQIETGFSKLPCDTRGQQIAVMETNIKTLIKDKDRRNGVKTP